VDGYRDLAFGVLGDVSAHYEFVASPDEELPDLDILA